MQHNKEYIKDKKEINEIEIKDTWRKSINLMNL